ncbi:MAG: rod shape-determining protein MreC [Kiritimatiellae bacterium]|nr:rod shape-determining protein MreC [Kiritimatiellia bacterium]
MKARTTGTFAILAVAVAGAGVLAFSRSACSEAVYPVERAKRLFSQRVVSRICGMFRGAEARAENMRLRREVASLSVLRGDIERLEAENERFRRVLNYASRKPGEWLAAGVLSSGGAAAGAPNVLRVDKGSLAGVREGAVVVAPEGLVGRVTAVSPHVAEITRITDRSIKVACAVETGEPGSLAGILSGGGDDLLVLRHMTGATEAPPRARVVTSGIGGVFPKGIEVGTLLGVRTDADGLSREGDVLPSVDFPALEDVFIRRGK